MRILIIGAGVLGSNLAHSLKKGNNVTILAINKTFENLKNNGLIIKHKFGKKTVDYFNIIDKLDENDIYDVIFIVTRFSSLDSIVPIIENNKSKNIVFVGNNITAEKYAKIKDKNVLFAFFMAAGKKDEGYINSICLNKITIGRIDGKIISNEFIKSIFKETKIKVIIENKMNDYLKSHACISDHAMSAREEFILLESELEKLKEKSKLETKVYDKLKVELLN